MLRIPVLFAAAALAFAAGCSSTPDEPAAGTAQETAAPADPAKEEAVAKVADVGNQIQMARRKLDRAQMDVDQQKSDGDAAVAKATVERDLARKALAHFDAVDMPQRLAKAVLDLKDSSDYMTEQEEEMQQLELMYSKDDLADKTKEIVLARGKRRLDRAKQRYALAQKDHDDLKGVQLPEQRDKLVQALKEKELELQRAQFNAKAGAMDKETAVLAARQEIEKLGRELEKAKSALAAHGDPAGASVASFQFGQL